MWNHGGASVGPRANAVNVLSPASDYLVGAVEIVHRADPSIGRVCLLHGDSAFGRGVANGAAIAAARLGLRVERAVLPTDPPAGDLLLAAGSFDEERALAARALPGRWLAAGFVGAGVEDVLEFLGDERDGLLGPAQWLPSAVPAPDEGPDAAAFVAAYRERAGEAPPYPAAQAFAAGLVALRCLREAGTADDAALLAAARRLDCTTLFGRFRLDHLGRQVGHQMLTVQWQDGARVVVWPEELASAALRYPRRMASRRGRPSE